MSIRVEVRDENGNSEGPTWWHARSTELVCQDDPNTVCLRFIDPYGDTTFNQLQLPVLIEELRALESAAPDTEAKQVLSDLVAHVQTASQSVHTYVTFIGD